MVPNKVAIRHLASLVNGAERGHPVFESETSTLGHCLIGDEQQCVALKQLHVVQNITQDGEVERSWLIAGDIPKR